MFPLQSVQLLAKLKRRREHRLEHMEIQLNLQLSRVLAFAANPPPHSKLASVSKLDILCPLYAWYQTVMLRTEKVEHRGGVHRLRWWKDILLTPLPDRRNGLHPVMVKYRPHIALYSPAYPESYYHVREIWNQFGAPESILYMGREEGLGALESLVNCAEDGYGLIRPMLHCILTAGDTALMSRLAPLHASLPSVQVETVYLDTHCLLRDPTASPIDHVKLVYTLLRGCPYLVEGGSLIIRTCMTSGSKLLTLGGLLETQGDLQVYRPEFTHPWNPFFYMMVTNWRPPSEGWYHQLASSTIHTVPCSAHWGETLNRLVLQWYEQITTDGPTLAQYKQKHQIQTIDKTVPLLDSTAAIWTIDPPLLRPDLVWGIGPSLLHPSSIHLMQTLPIELAVLKRCMDTRPSGLWKEYGTQNSSYRSWEDAVYSRESDVLSLKKELGKRIVGVSSAWLKMWELLHLEPAIGESLQNCLHLCEAPGAFISAISQYAKNKGLVYQWEAQTLDAPGALGDDFCLSRAYPDQWKYGDITHPETIQMYAGGGYSLVTGDGGQPCHPHHISYDETNCLALTIGQTATILASLIQGGTALLKLFIPCTLSASLSILYIWASLFQTIRLIKPCSSGPCNSEVYLVGLGYRGASERLIQHLSDSLIQLDPHKPLVQMNNQHLVKEILSKCEAAVRRQKSQLISYYYSYYCGNDRPTRAEQWKKTTSRP